MIRKSSHIYIYLCEDWRYVWWMYMNVYLFLHAISSSSASSFIVILAHTMSNYPFLFVMKANLSYSMQRYLLLVFNQIYSVPSWNKISMREFYYSDKKIWHSNSEFWALLDLFKRFSQRANFESLFSFGEAKIIYWKKKTFGFLSVMKCK